MQTSLAYIDYDAFIEWFDTLKMSTRDFEAKAGTKGMVANIKARGYVKRATYNSMLFAYNLPNGTFEVKQDTAPPQKETETREDVWQSIADKLDEIIALLK